MASKYAQARLFGSTRVRAVCWVGCGLMAATALSTTTACRRTEITQARVAKSPLPASQGLALPGASRTDMPPAGVPLIAAGAGELPPPPLPSGSATLKWTLPGGWSQKGASGMRYGTLEPSTPGRIDISVVVLSGDAGGELANVNRWRSQIGLAPIDEPALGTARQMVKSAAGMVSVYDFVSEGQSQTRMVVGLLSANGGSWFFKMVGDTGVVSAARSDFMRWLETLRFDATND